MSSTSRPARWWEDGERDQRPQGQQGVIVSPAGRSGSITCPECKQAPIVYNGNYFCDAWTYPFSSADGECDWALPHPATRKRDREICDLLGIDYE